MEVRKRTRTHAFVIRTYRGGCDHGERATTAVEDGRKELGSEVGQIIQRFYMVSKNDKRATK